ncbi:MAG: DUF262 domain-containing protein, partial [Bdellovibrionaceae bacterium]|nr:DUF262 domain-containing protein [Pseudobdellovibrionaceae bacterium]
MINGFDIPKIYLADFTFFNSKLNNSDYFYAIIDGKQRLLSIFNFIENKIKLNKDIIYYKNTTLDLGGLTYKDLLIQYPEIVEEFENYNLSIISVITDEDNKIEEMFVRLNRGKSLTGSEIRSAMQGPIPKMINELAEHNFFNSKIKFEVKRKLEQNLVAKLIIIESNLGFTSTKKKDIDDFVLKNKNKEVSDFIELRSSIKSNLDTMSSIFQNKDPLLKSSGPIVLYYWLAKNKKSESLIHFRDFLSQFEKFRLKKLKDPDFFSIKNSEIAEKPWRVIADNISKYSYAIRSINDQKSMKLAFEILKESFELYINSKTQLD